jgi:thiosulfate reductase/polysulfide reductase chain A
MVRNKRGEETGPIRVKVTERIPEDSVYMVHGFGKQIPLQSRSYHAGISDQKLMVGKLDDWDQAGGAINLCESFVLVRRSVRNPKRRVEL